MDLLVERSLANGKRLQTALTEFGFGSLAPRPEQILEPDTFWQFGRKPLRVDVLTHIPAVTFASAWKRRVKVTLGELEVPVLGLDDLIANKRAAGRTKDVADAEMLEAVRSLSKRR